MPLFPISLNPSEGLRNQENEPFRLQEKMAARGRQRPKETRPLPSSSEGLPGTKKRTRPGRESVHPLTAAQLEELPGSEQEDAEEETPWAYAALLKSLQTSGGSFGQAYARRRREEQGDSSSEEEEDLDGNVATQEEAEEHGSAAKDAKLDESRGQVEKIETVKNGGEDDEEDRTVDEEILCGNDAESNADLFKLHLEHGLSEAEIGKLQGKQPFTEEFPAAGVQGGKWVSTTSQSVRVEKNLANCGVKQRLQTHWQKLHDQAQWADFVSEQQCQFFSLCRSYGDVLHSRRSGYPAEKEDLSIMDAYLLHVLNHVLKTRDLVTRNNDKPHSQTSGDLNGDIVEAPRDQGFTRPKVLVLLPFRSAALKLISRLLELAPTSQKASIEHKQRFFDDFGAEEGDDEEAINKSGQAKNKPADFRALFSANNDDHFRMGLKFTRKSIKLYSDFYSSDVIVASPIGLVTKLGEAESEKGKDIDFLSSIEIFIVDYIEVILMQNWSHVLSIVDHLNKIPSQQHGTDLMRVREWYLNGHARHFRQTILLSSFSDAGVNALFHRSCVNHAGKVKLRSSYTGVLSKVILQVRQVYERIDCRNPAEVDNARFEFFVKQVFPRIKDPLQGGTMLFIRSYFDFVRLRNFLKSQDASFCLLGEYTKQSDISRARAWFYHGKRKMMLYTERAHFYHRYKVRGIRELIFYSLPDNGSFYVELLNMLEGVENPSSTVLFSQFDNLQLERIVGSSRTQKMLASQNRMFMFC